MARPPLLPCLVFCLVALAPMDSAAQPALPAVVTPDERWERAFTVFESIDRAAPPPQHGILFVGSSTIQRWDVAAAFPGVPAINRGVSSSELGDAVRYVDRLVLPYNPRVVVVYAGDNDIDNGKTSEEVAVQFERFTRRVWARLPETRFVFIGLKPSILRWSEVHRMRLANALIREYCGFDDRLAFVDVDGPMLGWDEKPRKELFVDDGLHLSRQGYELWNILLRPFLQ